MALEVQDRRDPARPASRNPLRPKFAEDPAAPGRVIFDLVRVGMRRPRAGVYRSVGGTQPRRRNGRGKRVRVPVGVGGGVQRLPGRDHLDDGPTPPPLHAAGAPHPATLRARTRCRVELSERPVPGRVSWSCQPSRPNAGRFSALGGDREGTDNPGIGRGRRALDERRLRRGRWRRTAEISPRARPKARTREGPPPADFGERGAQAGPRARDAQLRARRLWRASRRGAPAGGRASRGASTTSTRANARVADHGPGERVPRRVERG